MSVVLDLHNYGYGLNGLVGATESSNESFADFWGKMGEHFAAKSHVLFGLMNEPHKQSATDWLTSVNGAIDAIRDAGADSQTILVPGTYWDGAWTWTTTDNASVIGAGVEDPKDNIAFEVHQYLDDWSTGTTTQVVSETIGAERLEAVTEWASDTGNQLFLGEFGAGADETSLTALDGMLSYMSEHQDVWKGATYWAGGAWWGDYALSIEPRDGVDSAQMNVMEKYADLTI
jgi:endoglucanase